MIDKEPTGPGIKIKFPFDIKGEGRGFGTAAQIKGNEISYLRELKEREDVYIAMDNKFETNGKDYDFRIENLKTGAGVRILGDKPLSKMVFWANPSTSCPEPYIQIKADPGKEFKWNITYEFYEASK